LLSLCLPSLLLAQPLSVFTSVVPMKTLVERIGGEHVIVQAMVPPGFNPHSYDPTPQQVQALANAALYVRSDVPFEHAWMGRIRSVNQHMRVLDTRDSMPGTDHRHLEPGPEHTEHKEHAEHTHGHAHAHGTDPHFWTDPVLTLQVSRAIRDALANLDPAHRGIYARNQAELARELQALDADIRHLLAPLRNRTFMVFHPAWGHFAEHYGLEQIAIEHEGKQPGARSLASLIELAREKDIRVVFVQPQFDARTAQQVARAIDGRVIVVDPLAPDYMANLRRVAQAFAEALQP
jgi:zinc transport system substrate-binding protein